MQLRLVIPSPKPAPYPPTPTYTYPPTPTYTYQPTIKDSPVCKQCLHLPLRIPNYNGFSCRKLQQVWHQRNNLLFILLENTHHLLYWRLHSEGILPRKILDVSTCAVTILAQAKSINVVMKRHLHIQVARKLLYVYNS